MLLNLLNSAGNGEGTGGGWVIWVVFGVAIVAMIVMNHFSNKKRRAQMEAEKEKRNAIQPGYKIVTIGGIVGVVVEINDEANTFVLKTGSEENPSFLTFDKVAIYTSEDPNATTDTEEAFEETSEENDGAEETVEEVVETSEEVSETVEEPAQPEEKAE